MTDLSKSVRSTVTLEPEMELLLRCARTQLTPGDTACMRALLEAGVSWPRLCDLTRRHGLTPLLYRHLFGSAADLIPARSMKRLRLKFYEHAGHNLTLFAELLDVLRVFNEKGIPAVPFKGPALAESAYGNVMLREYRDLDVLVRPRDVPLVRSLLRERGYESVAPLEEGAHAAQAARLQWGCDDEYVRAEDGLRLEIHWRLFHRYFSLPLEDACWKRTHRITLGERKTLAFSTEDELLMLCAHGAKHCWERLAWVADVAEVLKTRPDLDWAYLFGQARDLHAERMLKLGLRLAADLLDVELPADAHGRIVGDGAVRALAAGVAARSLSKSARPLSTVDKALFQLSCRDSWADRARYVALRSVNLNDRDWTLLPLPSALKVLYYPLRALRVAAQLVTRGRMVRPVQQGPTPAAR